jgi:pimeloyl-ACP methyl ester carboxylesterase
LAERPTIVCEKGGDEGPLLVLIHGLGANAAVWDDFLPLLEENWSGRWLIPDLRGHGRSFHRAPYGFGVHAADIAGLLDQDEEISIIGHSMGGAVAYALASGKFGVGVKSVVAFGVKVDWPEEDLARAQAVAQAPAKMFDNREDAIERYLRVSGLKGLAGPASRTAQLGVAEYGGKFGLASDPLINAVGRPDLVAQAKASLAPIRLLTGEQDQVGNAEGMRQLGPEVTVLPGLGHNLHVEAPETFWRAIENDL